MAFSWPVSRATHDRLQAELNTLERKLRAAHNATAEAERRAQSLRESLTAAERKFEGYKKEQEKSARERQWTSAKLAEFPDELWRSTAFTERTFACVQAALTKPTNHMVELVDPNRFQTRGSWAFYWILTHAANAACERADDGLNENGLTSALADGLWEAAEQYKFLFEEELRLEFGVTKLFEHAKGNVLEQDAGADLVLVLAGRDLTPTGGARLLAPTEN